MRINQFIKKNFIFILLFLILILSRLYKINNFFYFGIDEEYQALLAWSQIKNFHITWIGVSASNIGYYLGPGLTYLSAILLWLSHGNPISLAYFASFIGILTALSLYFITLKLYNFKTALISLFLYIFSPFAFYYDHRYWPIAIPLIALWLFYSLIQSFKNSRWLFLTAFLIGISYHIHITLWLFWPFIIFTFIYLFIKKKILLLTILISISIFMLITLPLLVFDFVHNFDNLKLPLRLITTIGQGSGVNVISRFNDFVLIFSKIFFSKYSSLSAVASILLFISFIFFCIHLTINNKKNYQQLLITSYPLLITLLFFFGFIFFPSPMQEYYFVLPLPFVILITSIILSKIRHFSYLILFTFFCLNVYNFIKRPIYSDYQNKLIIIKESAKLVKSNAFILEIDGEYLYNGGWRYLFQTNNLTPTQSTADNIFSWIYPDEISNEKPKYKLIISKNKNLQYEKITTLDIYTVYIFPNY